MRRRKLTGMAALLLVSCSTLALFGPATASAGPSAASVGISMFDRQGEFYGELWFDRRDLRQRDDLTLEVQRRLPDNCDGEDSGTSFLVASFPDGSICTLELDSLGEGQALYRLELQQHHRVFRALRGACSTRQMPSLRNGRIIVNLLRPHDGSMAPVTVLSQSLD